MKIREPDPASGKTIQNRRIDFTAEWPNVRPPHVVDHDDEQIGPFRGFPDIQIFPLSKKSGFPLVTHCASLDACLPGDEWNPLSNEPAMRPRAPEKDYALTTGNYPILTPSNAKIHLNRGRVE